MLLLSACGVPAPRHGGARPMSLDLLVERLRDAGSPVTVDDEPVEQPFFTVPGKAILVQDEPVQVFEYPSAEAAAADAARVSADGYAVGTMRPHWIGPPHFYRAGALLVLYLGTSEVVLKGLAAALGPPFAGS